MDLRLFWGVMKRYKRISIPVTLLAAVLAVFAYGTPGPHGITPRGSVTWEAQAQLLITQGSQPYTRLDSKTVAVGAAGYMSGLSPVYAGLANGTAVQAQIQAAKIPGIVSATEGVDPNTGAYTPFVNLTASAPTETDAALLVKRGIDVFQNYIAQSEAASGVPAGSRIAVDVVRNGLPPTIASTPKPTVPILVFIAVISGMIMLLFSLENHDPKTAAALGRVPASAAAAVIPSEGVTAMPRIAANSQGQRDQRHERLREAGEAPAALSKILKRG